MDSHIFDHKTGNQDITRNKKPVQDKSEKYGENTERKRMFWLLIAAMFLWIVPSLLRSSGPFIGHDVFSSITNAFVTNVTEAIPALIIIIAIETVKTGRNRPSLLRWDEMMKAVDWNIVIHFGEGLPLHGDIGSGLADWIVSQISLLIRNTEATSSIVFAVSAVMAFVISYAASNSASAVITCPIAASLAIGAGVNQLLPVIAAGLACSISSAIPSTTPPMAIVYSSRVVRISNMFKTGMRSDVIRLTLLILIGSLLIDLLF